MKYEEIKDLENRIMQLEILQKRILSLLGLGTFEVTLTTMFAGQKMTTPYFSIDGKDNSDTKEEDRDFIKDCIENRLKELRTQFKTETEKLC